MKKIKIYYFYFQITFFYIYINFVIKNTSLTMKLPCGKITNYLLKNNKMAL